MCCDLCSLLGCNTSDSVRFPSFVLGTSTGCSGTVAGTSTGCCGCSGNVAGTSNCCCSNCCD